MLKLDLHVNVVPLNYSVTFLYMVNQTKINKSYSTFWFINPITNTWTCLQQLKGDTRLAPFQQFERNKLVRFSCFTRGPHHTLSEDFFAKGARLQATPPFPWICLWIVQNTLPTIRHNVNNKIMGIKQAKTTICNQKQISIKKDKFNSL